MPRIRTIKPEFWMHEGLGLMSSDARLTAIGILNLADDEGFLWWNAAYIASQLFMHRIAESRNIPGTFPEHSRNTPGTVRDDSATIPTAFLDMPRIMADLVAIGYVEPFVGSDGKTYGLIVHFKKHQVISKPRPSKIKRLRCDKEPIPGTFPEHSRNTPGTLPDMSRAGTGEQGNRGTGEDTTLDTNIGEGGSGGAPLPDTGVSGEDWKSACECADLIERAVNPTPVVEPGSRTRRLALAMLANRMVEKGEGSWDMIHGTLEAAVQSTDSRLIHIIGDLRKFPDGAYPGNGNAVETRTGEEYSRIEQAAKIVASIKRRYAGFEKPSFGVG